MATVTNLTLPIAPDMPVGQLWAHDMPFQMEPIRTYAAGGAQLEYYQFHTETGTRLVTRARHDPHSAGLGGLDFLELVDRKAVVIDIPKAASEKISERDIDSAVAGEPAYGQGDALLIRTGWGDVARCRDLGEDFSLQSPRLTAEAAARLTAILRVKKTTLLAIDTPCLVGCGDAFARSEWLSMPPWQRPHWPSDIAKAYLRHYRPAKEQADWGGDRQLLDASHLLLAICNAAAIKTRHVRITALPFFAEGAPSAPTTVIAKAA